MTLPLSDIGSLLDPVKAEFFSETGFLLVHLDKINYGFYNHPVWYAGKVFQPKKELHITILSHDASLVLKHLENNPDDIYPIRDLIRSTDWAYRKENDFYYATRPPEKETLVQMVSVPHLPAFLRSLSKLVGHGFILPPTHVTLYTRETEMGISLATYEEFKNRVKARVLPEEVEAADGRHGSASTDQGLA